MNNLLKLVVKNLISIILAFPMAFIVLAIINVILFNFFFSLMVKVCNINFGSSDVNTEIQIERPDLSQTIFSDCSFLDISSIAVSIIVLIACYLIIRRLLGKFIK